MRLIRDVLLFSLAFIVALFGLALLHELLIVTVGSSLTQIFQTAGFTELVTDLPLSPAHSKLMVETLTQIRPQGIVVPGITGTWVSAVVDSDSTPLARFATQMITEILIIYFGLILVGFTRYFGHRGDPIQKQPTWSLLLLFWGFFLQVQAGLSIVGFPLSQTRLEEMGLGFLVGPMTQGDRLGYEFFLAEVLPATLRALLLTLGFWPLLITPKCASTGWASRALLALGILSLTMFSWVLTPYFGTVPGEINSPISTAVPKTATSLPLTVALPNPISPAENPTAKAYAFSSQPEGPTVVRIQPTSLPGEFRLLVNETPVLIRGVQYYFGDLINKIKPERDSILQRDLSIIQQVGFTTVAGWEEQGFDENFLKFATEYGLSVIKPISLHPGGNYKADWNPLAQGDFLDISLREQIKENVRRKILWSKNFPAIIAWNIGADEPLEQMVRHYQRSPDQVQAAANLIVEITVLAHEIDPAHPTLISEPQDWYLPYYQVSLEKIRRAGVEPSPFFIVGGNFYGQPTGVRSDLRRVKKTVVENLRVNFAVTEWAPFGVDRQSRPSFRVKMAEEVAQTTPIAITYVFNPAADPLNPNVADQTQAIITGLSLTNFEREDGEGLLAALGKSFGRPLLPTALKILKADRQRGWSGVPVSRPIPQEKGIGMYFVTTKTDGRNLAYRWILNEKTDALIGPETVSQALFNEGVLVPKALLQTYLEAGGPSRIGYPLSDAYEVTLNGQRLLRQDFSRGWSIAQPLTNINHP